MPAPLGNKHDRGNRGNRIYHRGRGYPPRATDEQIIASLQANGHILTATAEELGTSYRTVKRVYMNAHPEADLAAHHSPRRAKGHTNRIDSLAVTFNTVWRDAGKEVRRRVWVEMTEFQRLVVDIILRDPHTTPYEIGKSIKEPTQSVNAAVQTVLAQLRGPKP